MLGDYSYVAHVESLLDLLESGELERAVAILASRKALSAPGSACIAAESGMRPPLRLIKGECRPARSVPIQPQSSARGNQTPQDYCSGVRISSSLVRAPEIGSRWG